MASDDAKIEAQKYLVSLLQQMSALAQTNAQLVQQNAQLMQQNAQISGQLALMTEALSESAIAISEVAVELRQRQSVPSDQLVDNVLAAIKSRLAPPFPPPSVRPIQRPRPAFPRS